MNDRQELFAREDAKHNVNIVGLQEKKCNGVQSLMQIIEYGSSVRVVGNDIKRIITFKLIINFFRGNWS